MDRAMQDLLQGGFKVRWWQILAAYTLTSIILAAIIILLPLILERRKK